MRGTHYGADYRWFTRFIGDEVDIPKVDVNRDEVDDILAERGLLTQPALDASDPIRSDSPDLHRVTGRPPSKPPRRPKPKGPHRPGSLKAAMARPHAAAPSPTTAEPELTPEVKRLASVIENSFSPRELAQYSFEQLVDAFRASKMNPGTGSKIVQAWASGREMSPEEVVRAVRRVKDEWLTHQQIHAPDVPPQMHMDAKDWKYDAVVADVLNQRDNVGRGPKDIDRERLKLLRRLMASFSGQANYGFTGIEAVVEAAESTDVLK